jgi:hypothetical protein
MCIVSYLIYSRQFANNFFEETLFYFSNSINYIISFDF